MALTVTLVGREKESPCKHLQYLWDSDETSAEGSRSSEADLPKYL